MKTKCLSIERGYRQTTLELAARVYNVMLRYKEVHEVKSPDAFVMRSTNNKRIQQLIPYYFFAVFASNKQPCFLHHLPKIYLVKEGVLVRDNFLKSSVLRQKPLDLT